MFRKILTAACLTLGFSAFAPTASAAFIQTYEGNDCAGVFGQPFADCKIPANHDPNQTPIIIKFNFEEDGSIESIEINATLFPTIDGSEFSFNFGGDGTGDGIWTYNPGAGDPGINFFVAKGGPNFNLFSNLGDPLTDDWFTPTNPQNGQLFGLSHLSFYDTTGRVPEPMPLALLGAGLIGLFLIRRRRTS